MNSVGLPNVYIQLCSPDLERRKAWTREGEAFRFKRLDAISAEAASCVAGTEAAAAGTCTAVLAKSGDCGLQKACVIVAISISSWCSLSILTKAQDARRIRQSWALPGLQSHLPEWHMHIMSTVTLACATQSNCRQACY